MPNVDPYLGFIYQIPFGQSGMMAHENRWLAKPTELTIAENVTFENDVLQKDAAFVVYDPIGLDTTSYAMQVLATGSANWQGTLTLNVGGTGAPVFLKNLVAGSQSSPWAITVAATAPAGSLIVVSVYVASSSVQVTDSKANIYQLAAGGTVGGSAPGDPTLNLWQFQTFTQSPLVNGVDTITVTFAGGLKNLLFLAASYSGTGVVEEYATNTAAGTTIIVPDITRPWVATPAMAPRYSYPMLGVGTAFLDDPALTLTVSSNYGAYQSLGVRASLAGLGQIQQFYRANYIQPRITAQIDWNPQFTSGANIAGTVTITQGLTNVTGAGTSFLSVFRINDEIIVNSETQVVASIVSNTVLTTYNPWTQNSASAQTAVRGAGPCLITAGIINFTGGPGNGGVIAKEGTAPPTGGLLFGTQLVTWTPFASAPGRFVVAGKESAGQSRKLFYFDGVQPVRYLADDGTTMSVIAAPSPDWAPTADAHRQPVNGILHQGALFAWGNLSDGHRIYRSRSADHTSFTNAVSTDDAGQYPIASSIGERLWGGAEFQGVLFLWKYPRGIFYFDDTDPNFLNWTYHIRSEALGCAPSPHAVLPIDDDVLFCAPDGHFHLLSAVANLGGVSTSDLTRLLGLHRWTREHIDVPSLGKLCATYNPLRKIAYFGVRSRAATGPDNDLLLKFDFGLVGRNGPIRFSYSTQFRPNALCTRRSASTGNPQAGTLLLMIGESSTSMLEVLDDGTVGTKLTHGYRTDAARGGRFINTSYPITATVPRLDFADVDPMNRQRRKNYDFIEFIFGEADISDLSGQTVTAQIRVDGALKQTITLTNITQTRVLRQLRVGDGFDWQVTLSTASVVSAAAVTPVIVPDMVGLGLQVGWRPGSQDHPNVLG